ncbi:aldo/keto reductase [Actinomadura barringtoniae]|uniref:Aldo/keto reductase n=1 Tax=Actinomadura barringtoniae TaxID=1427535 RepID=A0A939PND3_9ACTN|nr:aldo/keto reductase [Actinomadura barringtoniae]MBO2455435.1 aldo/keto reductase [Actinomadura barringtoniae]
MRATLGLGTYRCRDVTAAAQAAIAAGVTAIDTAPVYARGTAHAQLAPLLADHPDARVSTKVGHMTHRQAQAAQRAGVITAQIATRGHCIAPDYLEHQVAVNAAELGRERLDLLYLHNPEHDAHGDRDRLLKQITQAFAACEKAAHDGKIHGYGIATWSGFTSGAFTVRDLLTAAHDAAGSTTMHLSAIQLPVSLVQLAPLAEALDGAGPIAEANEAGLQVWASAPLSGGELADMVTRDLARLISPDLSPVAAALAAVASTPGLTGALLSASTPAHWQDALSAFDSPPIPPRRLREICRVLRA